MSYSPHLLKLLFVILPMVTWQPAHGQSENLGAPIKVVVPFAAGTPTDAIARALGQGLTKSLNRPVVVENRPGAAGNIGTQHAASAAPDGLTLLLTVNSTVTVNPLLYSKLKYDPMKDLAPVALVAVGGYLLVANPQTQYRTVADLVQAARNRPGVINYASYGAGSMSHMCAEVFQAAAGVKLFHVPYKAGSLTDILSGQIEIGFEPVGPAIAHVQAGRLTGLGTTARSRLEALPAIPPIAESFAGYDCTAWVGLLAPARLPAQLRKALGEQVLRIAASAEFAELMKGIGLTAQAGDAQQFAALIKKDHEKWSAVVKPLAIKLD